MICEKCGNDFTPRKNYKKYCSDKCRYSRVFSDESKIKKSKATKKLWKQGSFDNINWSEINSNSDKLEKSKKTWTDKLEKRIEKKESNIWVGTYKKFITEKYGHKCMSCGITEWNDSFVHLEMDHIDGNNKNNDLNNLRLLCPNCHSQTPTWRYKNIGKNIKQS